MVVNRKQPAAPAPLVQSRSTSQQPIAMRKKQSKHFTSNGINSHKPEHVPSMNPDQKSKSTSKPRPRKKYLRDKLAFWSLSLFSLYSFLVCSPYTTTPQKSQSHLICRVESNYKTYVIDPFILPPLKYTFSFTHSLAKPYISQANTHLEPYLGPVKQVTSTVKPYVIQAVTTTTRVWQGTLTPFYKNTLKSYYQSTILPRYNLYLRPYLLPLVARLEHYYAYYVSIPIRIQCNRVQLHFSTLYAAHIHSYISHLQPYVRRFTSTISTTWFSSVHFYGTHIQPTLLSTWIRTQPYLSFAFDLAKDISLNVVTGTANHLKGLAKQVGTQRRTYVDPHIRKIWDKVEENATAKMTTAPVDISLEEETAKSTIFASLVMDEAVTPITYTNEPATVPTDVLVPEEDAQDILYLAESTPSPFASSPPHAASTQEEAQSAVSIAEASAHGANTILHELEREVKPLVGGNAADATTSAIVEDSELESKQREVIQAEVEVKPSKGEMRNEPVVSATKQSPDVIPTDSTAGPSSPRAGGVIGVGASSPPTSHSTIAAEEHDLDDFLRDIGIDNSSSSLSLSPTPTQPSEADETAAAASAQEAEFTRLALIASKRLAITTRHTTFESDLQSAILTSTSQTIDKLNEMREAKREELTRMIEGTSEGEGLVTGLTLSGDKLMKGLDVYLKKCQGRSGTWKSGVIGNDNKGEDEEDIQKRTGMAKDEQTRLESVIEKVEIKFLDVVNKLQEQVNGWYLGMIQKEQEEVSQIATEIQNMAEQAQASLGMDYAWLEDVTYMDWQRYHDLVRASEKFLQTVNAIQNGTSVNPPSPPNPVKPVINALQEELQTVVLGFHVALGSVKNTIPELFSIHGSTPERDEGAGVGEEDKVRIQPIDPDVDGEKTRQSEGFDASKIIIGKSKEQIEQALGDVPLVIKHEEL